MNEEEPEGPESPGEGMPESSDATVESGGPAGAETDGEPERAPSGGTEAAEPGSAKPRRRLPLRPLPLVVLLVLVTLMLVAWNRTAHSDRFCASCHSMDRATLSAARSVHDDVSCLACHTGPGLLGSLRYIPTLGREVVATVTGWNVADGVLQARDCQSCHTTLTTSPALKAAHTGGGTCDTCHGDVSHPVFRIPGAEGQAEGEPHPKGFIQTHGQQVAADPGSCQSCHEPKFCQACHFRSTFPHPEGWIQLHGQVQEEEGADACVACHPTTFCVGCHGTEIPHRTNWLGEHWRALQDAPASPCLVCHPTTDCTSCHSEHNVHPEQGLFAT